VPLGRRVIGHPGSPAQVHRSPPGRPSGTPPSAQPVRQAGPHDGAADVRPAHQLTRVRRGRVSAQGSAERRLATPDRAGYVAACGVFPLPHLGRHCEAARSGRGLMLPTSSSSAQVLRIGREGLGGLLRQGRHTDLRLRSAAPSGVMRNIARRRYDCPKQKELPGAWIMLSRPGCRCRRGQLRRH
jgi:hypothetical protein